MDEQRRPFDAGLESVESGMARLGVGRSTVFNMVKREEIRSIRLGRRRMLSSVDIDAVIVRGLGDAPARD